MALRYRIAAIGPDGGTFSDVVLAQTDLVVENGQGLPNADAYCDVAFVRAYWDLLGGADAINNASDEELRSDIREITRFVDSRYNWLGVPVKPLFQTDQNAPFQKLNWPRRLVNDPHSYAQLSATTVPVQVRNAVAHLVKMRREGLQLYAKTANTGALTSESFSIGGVSESKSYAAPVHDTYTRVPIVDDILTGLYASASVRKVRW